MQKIKWRKYFILFSIVLMMVNTLSVARTNPENIPSINQMNAGDRGKKTLITEYNISDVLEIDYAGNILWEKTGLNKPFDAERLENGNTLITEQGGNRVIEVSNAGNIIWEKNGLNDPVDAERLENGNTLITEQGGNRVIEVSNTGNIVWEKNGLNDPVDAERLENGNTLITEFNGNRLIEVDNEGLISWEILGLQNPYDAERLDNGNTLITEYSAGRVLEVDNYGNIEWQKTGLYYPCDAERLDDGNTLIVESGIERVIEIDTTGVIVWDISWVDDPIDAERIIVISDPPITPTIDGPTSGKVGDSLIFEFTSTDPDGDEIEHYIEWGDGDYVWTSFYPSGASVSASHIWNEQGSFTIRAKAIDTFGEESDWETHVVSITKSKEFIINSPVFNIIKRIVEVFPQTLLSKIFIQILSM